MAEISRLSRLVNGIQRQVDLSSNTLVVGDIKIGGSGGTLLTKTSLDALLAISSNLASTANGLGASLVGIEDAAGQFTAATVEGALAESLDAAQAAQSDADAAQADATQALADAAAAQATADAAIPLTQKGANNGVATLDGGGKVPVAQLPSSVMTYEGVWNASTNSPSLADGAGDAGMVYRVGTAGSQDLGSGSISFDVGDYVIYNGTIWEKSDTTDAVASVNGQTGIVSLDTDDISEGSNLYYTQGRFDTAFAAKDTDDLSEGSTNLYFTDARAKTAAVVDSTAGDETDQAPSVSAIKDYVAAQIAGINTAALARSVPAGESLASASLFALRWGKPAAAETAGRGYKADNDATSADNFHVMGVVLTTGAASAGDPVSVTKAGRLVATGHGFTVGQPIYLGASGALTNTAPSAANSAVVKLGVAEDANTIDVSIEIMGVN